MLWIKLCVCFGIALIFSIISLFIIKNENVGIEKNNKKGDIFVILCTSFVGSYYTIKGISLIWIDTFPSITTLEYYTWETFPKVYYGYCVKIILLTMISFYIQLRNTYKKDEFD